MNEKNGQNEYKEQNVYNEHLKKKIAPIVVTILMLVYWVVYFGFLISCIPSAVIKVLLGVIPLALGISMIVVCAQRLKEIDKGEDDDLSKY